MKKIKSFLFGLGDIGFNYDYVLKKNSFLTHAKSLNFHNKYKIVGAYDTNNKKNKKFEKKYQLKANTNYKANILETKPDLIIVATPTKTHRNLIENQRKFKLILSKLRNP